MTLHPAEAGHGVAFLRTGLPGGHDRIIDARHLAVTATELCTVIGDRESGAVATIEHLMSALIGLGIDNVLVEIDGPEVPILDGSAAEFIDAIDQAGIAALNAPRRYIKVLKPVRVTQGEVSPELLPNERATRSTSRSISRARPAAIAFGADIDPPHFRREIPRARTFGFCEDVEKLWAAGHALGSSLDNSVVIGDDGVINIEGLRYEDEFVRHKILDAVGDLALAGAPLLGSYRSYRGGHRLNFAVSMRRFRDRRTTMSSRRTRREPGYGRARPVTRPFPPYSSEVH